MENNNIITGQYKDFFIKWRAIQKELEEISEYAYGDMEGTDAKEFFQAEAIYVGFEDAARIIQKTLNSVMEIDDYKTWANKQG